MAIRRVVSRIIGLIVCRFPLLRGYKLYLLSTTFRPQVAVEPDLVALASGNLDDTHTNYSYFPEERAYDVQQMDLYLGLHPEVIEALPMKIRPFTQFMGALATGMKFSGGAYLDYPSTVMSPTRRGQYSTIIVSADEPWRRLWSDGKTFGFVEKAAAPPLERLLFSVAGAEYRVTVREQVFTNRVLLNANPEGWAIAVVDPSNAHPWGEFNDGYYNYSADEGRLQAFGEPVPVPKADYPFVDVEGTRELWENPLLCEPGDPITCIPYAELDDFELSLHESFSGSVNWRVLGTFGKLYLMDVALIDESNPWTKVFDNTDRIRQTVCSRPKPPIDC